jgi:hypothetical protein
MNLRERNPASMAGWMDDAVCPDSFGPGCPIRAGSALRNLARRVAIAVAIAITMSGCLVLAIPSVAYEGYKYEQKPQAASGHRAHPTPTPDDSIE